MRGIKDDETNLYNPKFKKKAKKFIKRREKYK